MPLYNPSSSASAITVKDEGASLSTAASSLDFVGAGVTASGTTADKTITIPGGSNQLASIAAASAAIAATETVVVSTSLAANYLTAGMSFRIRAAGVGSTGATAGADTFRVRIGTTTLTGNIPTSVAPTANDSVTAQAFGFEAIVTVRTTGATGTIIGECQALGDNATTGLFTTLNDLSVTTATVVVDTTATNLLELTFQSGSAGSSCTFHVATIEVLSSGGTSGTYTAQLSYVEFTAAVSVTGTTEAGSNNIVTSAAVTYDGSTPVMIDFFAPNVNCPNVASGFIVVLLYEDATILGLFGILRQPGTTSANMTAAMSLSRRITPAAGSKAYSIKAYVGSGTGTITAGAGGTGTYLPGFIRISKAA